MDDVGFNWKLDCWLDAKLATKATFAEYHFLTSLQIIRRMNEPPTLLLKQAEVKQEPFFSWINSSGKIFLEKKFFQDIFFYVDSFSLVLCLNSLPQSLHNSENRFPVPMLQVTSP